MSKMKTRLLYTLQRFGYALTSTEPWHPSRVLTPPQLREYRRLAYDWSAREMTTDILGPKLHILNSGAFAYLIKEIWCREIYRFESDSDAPVILDCGANMGVATLYFKNLYPSAKVTAFEPDEAIFQVLEKNVRAFDLTDVTLKNVAVWKENAKLQFERDSHSTAGRLSTDGTGSSLIEVKAERLRPYLEQPVDFLKLDIEGAEVDVLQDCSDLMPNVQNAFVEYHSRPDEPQQFDTVLRILREAGFRVYIEQSLPCIQHPFVAAQMEHSFDLLVNVFATRPSAE